LQREGAGVLTPGGQVHPEDQGKGDKDQGIDAPASERHRGYRLALQVHKVLARDVVSEFQLTHSAGNSLLFRRGDSNQQDVVASQPDGLVVGEGDVLAGPQVFAGFGALEA
jgi:hypothetical protein